MKIVFWVCGFIKSIVKFSIIVKIWFFSKFSHWFCIVFNFSQEKMLWWQRDEVFGCENVLFGVILNCKLRSIRTTTPRPLCFIPTFLVQTEPLFQLIRGESYRTITRLPHELWPLMKRPLHKRFPPARGAGPRTDASLYCWRLQDVCRPAAYNGAFTRE